MTEPGPVKERITIRGVIFDMDGVLTDSEPLINAAAVAMFKEKGLAVLPEDFLPFVGTGEDRYIGGVAEKYHFKLDLPSAKARTYEIYLELVPKQLRAFPGAHDLVNACRQAGLHLAVASSADRVKVEANLRQIGLPPETWNAVICGEDVLNKKPAPDIFLCAAAKIGLVAGQCAVVEDAINGVEAAKAAGMRCVAVAQTFSADRLEHADLARQNLLELSVADLLGEPDFRGQAQPTAVNAATTIGSPQEPDAWAIRPWGFWATMGLSLLVLIGVGITQVLAVVISTILTKAAHPDETPGAAASNGLLLAIATCLGAPVVLGLSYMFARIRNGPRAALYLGFRPVQKKVLFRWSVAVLIFMVCSDALTSWLGRPIVPPFMESAYQTARLLPLFWLALIVGAPLAEETLFRGFLFEGILHSRLGAAGAVIISALSWALIHIQYDFYGVATVFFIGLLLGYARLRTGSIYATMFLHGLLNLVATIQTAAYLEFLS